MHEIETIRESERAALPYIPALLRGLNSTNSPEIGEIRQAEYADTCEAWPLPITFNRYAVSIAGKGGKATML